MLLYILKVKLIRKYFVQSFKNICNFLNNCKYPMYYKELSWSHNTKVVRLTLPYEDMPSQLLPG